MLYITRKIGEAILIDNNLEIIIKKVEGNKVTLEIHGDKNCSIIRKELATEIIEANLSSKDSFFDTSNT